VYTIEEANELLPQVRAIILGLAVEQHRTAGGGDAASGQAAITAFVSLLDELGVQLRDIEMGLVDFPGERDGRPVWLCWRLADPTVAHWHGTQEGYASRRTW
jgi:hypothetical protein